MNEEGKERPARMRCNCRLSPNCKEWYDFTEEYFYRHKNKKWGLSPECKICHRWRTQKRYNEEAEWKLERARVEIARKEPIGTPTSCGICGNRKRNIITDINEETKRIYGYLCAHCWRVITSFDTDAKTLQAAADYLNTSRELISLDELVPPIHNRPYHKKKGQENEMDSPDLSNT